MNIPQVGDFIRVNEWSGVICGVFFEWGDAENPMLEILFIKNIFKGQLPEFHRWADLEPHTVPATRGMIDQEIGSLRYTLAARLTKFQPEAT